MSAVSAAASAQDIKRWAVKTAISMVILSAVLLIAAGKIDWPDGWAFLLMSAATQVILAVWLLRTNPDLLVERSRVREGTKRWDLPLVWLVARILPMATLITAGLDERFNWIGYVQPWMRAAALVVAFLSAMVTAWAMASNPFFSSTVRIQSERGQTVVREGPYRWVRHPGYAASNLFQLMVPFALNSQWALIPALVTIAVLAYRTALEDRTLQKELPGYAEYARQVRYRLLPGIW